MKLIQHFKTITKHRHEVMKGCFRIGLFRQGLLHDLSKYMPDEFSAGVKYYQGTRSPNAMEREENGFSTAWMHHKGRNKHHYEYWSDFDRKSRTMIPAPMPTKYVAEMYADRVAACKVYEKDQYTESSALKYFDKAIDKDLMHEKTRRQLRILLNMLATKGEEKTNAYIRKQVLHNDNFFTRLISRLV
ncbi:MAG: catalase [Lachnospiraceae bacterium]|nr:catalase [Candidatus Merdinaster equi]